MTKHYVSSSEVPHLWAHQAQDWAKGGNLSFEGKALKSYGLTIARIVDDCYGTPIAVILDDYDSHTTRHHINMARRAVYNVLPCVTSIPRIHGELQHVRNIAALLADAKASASKALTCQPENVEWKLYPARQRLKDAQDYSIAFALAEPDTTEFDAIVTKALLRKNRLENDTKRTERNEKAAKRRVAHLIAGYRAGARYSWREIARIEAVATDDDKKARNDAIRAKNKIAIAQWLNGYDNHMPYGYIPTTAECAEHDKNVIVRNQERIDLWRRGERVYLPLSRALLRISGSEIETSLGARFPIEHAKKAFPLIKACHDNSKSFTPNGHAVHLGHYQLSSVDEAGNVTAGCHRVAWAEIELMATQLGLE